MYTPVRAEGDFAPSIKNRLATREGAGRLSRLMRSNYVQFSKSNAGLRETGCNDRAIPGLSKILLHFPPICQNDNQG